MLANKQNDAALQKNATELAKKVLDIFEERMGKPVFQAIIEATEIAVDSGIDPENNNDILASAPVKKVIDETNAITEQLKHEAMKMKGGQIAGIAAATLAAVALTAFAVHKYRENNAQIQPVNDQIAANSPAAQHQMQMAH
jgi:type VI protein secretion system component VasK